MKYVFFGTPRFAEIILDRLIERGLSPIALVANPDRPAGRKKITTLPPTKALVVRRGAAIKIFQPETFDENLIQSFKSLGADLFVVAAYAKIIPKAVLDIPRLGTLGVHPSLLPKYRGASPIQSAILEGARETGATIYRMDEKMDHGPVLVQAVCDAGNGTIHYGELEERLAALGAELLIKIIPNVAAGTAKVKAQDESQATYTKKFTSEDGFVDESDLAAAERGDREKAEHILRKMNALTPEPGVWTRKNGRRVKLLVGSIANGALKLSKIQEEGGLPKSPRPPKPPEPRERL